MVMWKSDDEWFGGRKEDSNGNLLALKGIDFSITSDEDDRFLYEKWHNMTGTLKVETVQTEQTGFMPFGKNIYLPVVSTHDVNISFLPTELQRKLVDLWLEIEEALVKKEGK